MEADRGKKLKFKISKILMSFHSKHRMKMTNIRFIFSQMHP